MRWRRGTKVIGVIHQEHENGELELLSGSQITGITYLEKESEEVKLLSASKFDVHLLQDTTAAGVLYRDQTAADVQLLPGSKIAGVLYEEEKGAELKLLRAAHKSLKLVSGQAVKGLLYRQHGGSEIKLLSDVSNLSAAASALLIGVLHHESPMGALRLISGQAVKGLLYRQHGGSEIKLLSDVSDLSAVVDAQVAGILYCVEGSNQ
jgi:hypothetical protein